MTHSISLFDEAVLYKDADSKSIIIAREALPAEIGVGDEVRVSFTSDANAAIYSYKIKHCDDVNDVVTLDYVEEVLTEAPVITLSDAEMNNPDSISLRDIVAREEKKEAEAAAKAAADAKVEELKNKYSKTIQNFNDAVDNGRDVETCLETLFKSMVPHSGMSETVGGELVRATMRLLYRDYNDGDKFFEGYGLETCGSSAEYLLDQGVDLIENMLEDAEFLAMNDDAYTAGLNGVAERVINMLRDNNDLLTTPNTVDSRDYEVKTVSEYQPEYELEVTASDDVVTLIDNGIVTVWDMKDYLEEYLSNYDEFEDAEVARPWSHVDTTITVTNLHKDGYELLEENTTDEESFWEDFVNNYSDELDNLDKWDDEDSEEYDDEE